MNDLIWGLAFFDDMWWRFVKWTLHITSPSYRALEARIAEIERERRAIQLRRANAEEYFRITTIRLTRRPKPFRFPLPAHLRTGAAS